ncbi:MAG: hypothetical protein A2W91_01615 [Bacteroidetes bacterium GWF2_38_335]|nr:MAG: hypothetical protein A2W91_01615 [Bacteroidetes bacterium GWF2_38_335]OFY78769.1 MAG: hypothetical protein A2281_19190 [Bacteroidetes bacterium RIFOXYA12_FULL_38_20]HBS85161.1 hypothetical protein [Bacteroidales bacterium]
MALKKYTYLVAGLFIILSVSLFSCDDVEDPECEDYDYSSCDTWEPKSAELVISLTINEENLKVPITIYDGKIEDNIVVDHCTVPNNKLYYDVPIDHFYTVMAEYKSGDKTIFAVDGEEMKKKSSTVCDSTCWTVKGGYLNVTLRY